VTFSKKTLASILYPKKIEVFDRLNTNTLFVKEVLNRSDQSRHFENREEMYNFLHEKYIKNNQFDYLEFGVFEGAAIRKWTELNNDLNSRFYGFDSFEGLPEDWTSIKQKGAFDVNGQYPNIDDNRVEFVKGWFQETLPGFLQKYTPSEKLVIHIDADLYSSTLYCLTKLDEHIAKGTIIIFDEFYDLLHEFLAFHDYTRSYYKKWKIVANTNNYVQVALIAL